MIIIKKYRNRRFYNSSHSCYIRLPEIEKFVQDGEDIQVISHPEGQDLTKQILLELALKKSQLSQVFTNYWLQKIVQIAGTEEEELLLQGLFAFLEDGQVGAENEEEVFEEEVSISEEEPAELVKYVDFGSKGIPIQLRPDDLLELGWEEHSDTEEVEETQVSITNWQEEHSVEKNEQFPEKTVETIEDKNENHEDKEAFFDAISQRLEDSNEELISEEGVEQTLEKDVIIPEQTTSKEVALVDIQEEFFPEVESLAETMVELEEMEPLKDEVPEKKEFSQKELLQEKLAALKAKLAR